MRRDKMSNDVLENDKSYNGWSNYETWAVKLGMDDDEGSQELYQELAARCVKECGKEKATHTLAVVVKGIIDEDSPDLGASMYADLLGSALDNVDWREIAESLIEDLD
jgi:hypothetical protein